MTDKTPVRIPVDLDQRRYFTLDLAAVIRWEGLTDKPMFSKKTWMHFKKTDEMAMLLWCLLVGDDPELKPKDIIEMLEHKQINPDAALRAFTESLNTAWASVMINLAGGNTHGDQSR